MLRRSLLILAVLFVACFEARAQYDPSLSHYWAIQTAYNPAAVGKQDKININATYSMALAGFDNNPKTMFSVGDMPFYLLGAYHGVGVRFMSDGIGLFTHNNVGVQYAYKHKLFGGMLSVGIQGGMLSEKFDGSKVEMEQSNDLAIPTSEVEGNSLDFGAGLYYQRKNWYAGASVQHLTAPTIEMGETNQIKVPMSFYLHGGCNIQLRNPLLSIQPSVLGQSDGVSHRADITTRLTYTHEEKMMYAGVGYSPSNSVTVFLGGIFHGITLGYSYEAFTNGIGLGYGSHELFMGYQTDVNLFKKGRNRHQSVRIL